MSQTDQRQPIIVERSLIADRAGELMVLNAIAAAVATSLEPGPLLASALDHVLDLLELSAGGIFTRTDEQLDLIVHRGLAEPLVHEYAHLPSNHPLIDRIVAQRKPVVIGDTQAINELRSITDVTGFHSLLGLPLFARGEVAGLLVVFQARSNAFGPRETTLLEAIADHIALALDNARLFEAEQQRRRQAEALRKGALALTEALGLDAVLQRIVQQATELMEAPMCTIYECDPHSGALTLRAPAGVSVSAADAGMRLGQQIVNAAIQTQHAISVEDAADIGWQQQVGIVPAAEAALPFRSVLAAPLLVKGRVYGGIAVLYREQRSFNADEVQLIDIFADQAALALEHARLVDQSRQLAAIEERQRIARDLHDSVSQTLFSLSLAAQAARTTAQTDLAAADRMLETVQELASSALAEMRALIFELRPGALREAGLAAAIERFVGAFKARTGVAVTLDVAQQRLPEPVEEALYRITSEALANVGKHARASHVTVTLNRTASGVVLTVRDNGIGFDPRLPITGDHMGQRTMQERAAALGGSCIVQSAPGAGTAVIVDVPVAQSESL